MEFKHYWTSTKRNHVICLGILFLAAALFNLLPRALTGIPLSKQLSSDAEYHVVHWQEYSKHYAGSYEKDVSFRYDVRPAGELFVDKQFVKIADALSLPNEELSILLSVLALGAFLTGVYALSFFVLKNSPLALAIGLGSIIPTFALGGVAWGFSTVGYIPKELALGILVWLLLLFLYGKKRQSLKLKGLVFLMAGLLANWYPVGFFHFVAVLWVADVLLEKKLRIEHVIYGALFVGGGAFAIYDVLAKAHTTTAPDLVIMHLRYKYMLLDSLNYGVTRYLRRVILYFIWVCGLLFLRRRVLKKDEQTDLSIWKTLFISSGVLMLLGVCIEQYTVYAKLLFSRTSIYFLLSSMMLSAIILRDLVVKRLPPVKYKTYALSAILVGVFLSQSAFPSVYRSLRDGAGAKESRKAFLTAIETLTKHTSSTSVVLADPGYSNQIRAYGQRAVYSSWKDGGITLLDGAQGRAWYERFLPTKQVFQTDDFDQIMRFAQAHGVDAVFVEKRKIQTSKETYPSISAGEYVIVPVIKN